jgi:hypothetical protein
MKSLHYTALLAFVAVLGACGAQPSPAARHQTAAPSSLDASAAATRVADVRCRHEAACDNVGVGRRYATVEACVAELSSSAQSELAPRVCPRGIDASRLSTCALQFQRESCDPLAPLNRMYACDPPVLCSRAPGETFSSEDVYGI